MNCKMNNYLTCNRFQKKRKVTVVLKKRGINNILILKRGISIDGELFSNFLLNKGNNI